MHENKPANRLAGEKSPYLLQHAHNPVDWYPWGNEAFEKARKEDKPIFLSIGYSTCHWCHVMAHESFEDEEVADILNKHYVSIKVDREERPDIDNIYMNVCQAMTGQGGWPLTIIMTPGKEPFFAGTYFPKKDRWGRAGLLDILEQIAGLWQKDREHIYDISRRVTEAVKKIGETRPGELTKHVLDEAFEQFSARFDDEFGGFGSAPKFPAPHNLIFLLHYWKDSGEKRALEMVEKTLDCMARGGIYDHIGFGFHRYSTDRRWLVPHFEKMLYDNALIAMVFLEGYQATGNKKYKEVAEEVFSYIERDMTSPEGGFYSAEDADSEGLEGKFYMWTPEEVKNILGDEKGRLFCEVYDITSRGNFEGKNIPNLIKFKADRSPYESDLTNTSEEALRRGDLIETLKECKEKLFDERKKRVRPYKDDKILTSWNGLMIAALVKGARVVGDEKYAFMAKKAMDFILSRLIREDGRLLARYRDGEAAIPAYLDDYAFLVLALLELYETTFDGGYLKKALEMNRQMMELFRDEEKGGLFFYGKDGEELLIRPKEIYDGAIPSGNSVAAYNMLKLSRITGDQNLEEHARRIFNAFAGEVMLHPSAHSFLLTALQFALGASREIVIAGAPDGDDTVEMIQKIHSLYLPDTVAIFHPAGNAGEQIRELIPFIKDMKPLEGKATAYICENFACRPPVTNMDEIERALPVKKILP
ncbi:thioredoxin domain-containing protein [Thermoanaerobacteraceae bacterium SP2]|nr:thioredoxin domain-containing protein [Thermoanaerobacteraceae bacterium SP2]